MSAYRQNFNALARSMETGDPVDAGPVAPDLSDKQLIKPIGVLFDLEPPGKDFGDIHTDVQPVYRTGQTVKAVFWGGHPRNDLMTQKSYLTVEQRSGDNWIPVAYDWDPETIYRWKRVDPAFSQITVEWTIPIGTESGEYRISHTGHYKDIWTLKIKPYSGTSSIFRVSE